MEITWLGHSCFKIKGKEATVVTDPYDETIGYPFPRLNANIVTVSHGHRGHSYLARIDGNPKVVNRPGEYEIKGVFIIGLPNFHDTQQGSQRGKNVAYLIEMEDVRFCHLGDLGHLPSSRQVEELSDPGVLFVPVGGVSALDAKTAAELVRLLRPRVVIPMHYGTAVVPWLEPLSGFIKEMGLREVLPQPKISITSSNLPQETKVVILDYLLQ
jgi:L-ascorbate metabolism protein UlaG (beta-lactamase superfamily)